MAHIEPELMSRTVAIAYAVGLPLALLGLIIVFDSLDVWEAPWSTPCGSSKTILHACIPSPPGPGLLMPYRLKNGITHQSSGVWRHVARCGRAQPNPDARFFQIKLKVAISTLPDSAVASHSSSSICITWLDSTRAFHDTARCSRLSTFRPRRGVTRPPCAAPGAGRRSRDGGGPARR